MKNLLTSLSCFLILIIVALLSACNSNAPRSETVEKPKYTYDEPHRPQFHFTPPSGWMNDPNGMVYYQGEYHLFYQHFPDSTVWGPMHWGHAVSKDLVHWEHLPIALYPDSLGMIFSGSAVADIDNTSGFGTKENPPLVAIFTYHQMEGEKEGRTDFQTQGIAFSLDKGTSWTKYQGNPVLGNEGIKDFRDPKVMWYEPEQKWVMALAVYDHIRFYSSKNLKDWEPESSFGEGIGAHGGVWECPDLFKLEVEGTGQEKWVLLVSINPGGPNGGSATQYFIGDFDGRNFVLDEDFRQDLAEEVMIPEGKVFADFEGKTFGNWEATGEAFGAGPAEGAYFRQERVNNYVGKQLVNSFKAGKGAEGTLISPVFTINDPYLNFLAGGKASPDSAVVQLVQDGVVVRTATGNNSESLEWVSWNVEELKGQRARIVIADFSKDPSGHILADHFVFSEEPADKSKKEGIFIDYGTDNYAGVTWSGIPDTDGRRLFMGWMSNWLYGQEVPTEKWRSAMTVARRLTLENTTAGLRLVSNPVKELGKLHDVSYDIKEQTISEALAISEKAPFTTYTYELQLDLETLRQDEGFSVELSNSKKQKLIIGYDPARGQYYIDRTKSGDMSFSPKFSGVHYAPRLTEGNKFTLRLLMDVSSAELFADGGKTVMTEIFFPTEEFINIKLIPGKSGLKLNSGSLTDLLSIW